jgi:hypothetical protein
MLFAARRVIRISKFLCAPFVECRNGNGPRPHGRLWTVRRIGRYNRGPAEHHGPDRTGPGAAASNFEAPMFASCWLFAAATDSSKPPVSMWLWTILILTAVVLVAAAVIMSVGRWAKQPGSASRSSGEELASFRVLYERGEFSQEEYDRIRSRLSQKLRSELKVPAEKPAEPPAAQPAATSALSAAPADPTIVPDHAEKGPDTSDKPG